MNFIITRLFNLAWYWFIGYRVGDIRGNERILHAYRSVLNWWRSRQNTKVVTATVINAQSRTQE